MAIVQADLITKLRLKTGAGTTPAAGGDAIDDTKMLFLIGEGLVKMSRHLDRQVKEFLTTTAAQQDYVISTASGTSTAVKPVFIRHVFETASEAMTSDDFLFDSGSGSLESNTIFDSPAQYEAYMQQRAHTCRLVIDGFTYSQETWTISLEPTPTTTGAKVYFIAGYNHTLATAPAHYESVLMKYCEAEVLEALAAIRVRTPGITASGFPSYGEPRMLLEMAEKRRKDADTDAVMQSTLEKGRY